VTERARVARVREAVAVAVAARVRTAVVGRAVMMTEEVEEVVKVVMMMATVAVARMAAEPQTAAG
jgi:hypothetical protein